MSLVLMGSTSGSVTLQEPAVAGSTVLSLPATTGTVGLTTSQINFKNRIINGNMTIDQRYGGASANMGAGDAYFIDRWNGQEDTDGSMSIRQMDALDTSASNYEANSAPAGFRNSMKLTVTAADASIGATQSCFVRQKIEGLNVADLGWGTASAQTVTLSFWVKSSVTGTFGGSFTNSALNRCYPFTYAISAANTWEQKSITVPGDTTGTWLVTNGIGITVFFSLAMGSTYSGTANAWTGSSVILSATGATNLMATNGATFYITGVQLELGSAATTFDFRSIGTELALCQRYYYKNISYSLRCGAYVSSANNVTSPQAFPVTMRVDPVVTIGTVSYISNTSIGNAITATTEMIRWNVNVSGGAGADAQVTWSNYQFSSEL